MPTPPKPETVWISAMNRWVPTGHVEGSSQAEREAVGLLVMAGVIAEHADRLHAMRDALYARGRGRSSEAVRIQRRASTARSFLELCADERIRLHNIINAEKAQRRARFLQHLINTPEYLRAAASRGLIDAQIRELESIQRGDDAKQRERNGGTHR